MLAHPAHVIAMGLGSGLSPKAPGTVGTLWSWLSWLVLAVVFGIAASFAVLFANGAAITQASAATALLAGVLAGATAAGVTEVQRKADAVKDARKGE